jgi:hypothetical protein
MTKSRLIFCLLVVFVIGVNCVRLDATEADAVAIRQLDTAKAFGCSRYSTKVSSEKSLMFEPRSGSGEVAIGRK